MTKRGLRQFHPRSGDGVKTSLLISQVGLSSKENLFSPSIVRNLSPLRRSISLPFGQRKNWLKVHFQKWLEVEAPWPNLPDDVSNSGTLTKNRSRPWRRAANREKHSRSILLSRSGWKWKLPGRICQTTSQTLGH